VNAKVFRTLLGLFPRGPYLDCPLFELPDSLISLHHPVPIAPKGPEAKALSEELS
jgi:hypothetical protein